HAAIPGVIGILAGQVVGPGLLADREMIFDPEVLLDLALENGFRRFHAAAGQVFAFGDDTDADHLVVLRNVPEPALVRHVGDGGRSLIDPGIAFGPAII